MNAQGLRLDQGFDGTAYLARNPDVAAAGLDPLRHFLDFGSAEGRQATVGETPCNWASFNTSAGAQNGSFGRGINAAPPLQGAGAGSAGLGVGASGGGSFSPSNTDASAGGQGGFGASGADVGGFNATNFYGFSGANVSIGVAPGSFGSPFSIASAVNLGFGGQKPGTVSPYGFGGHVSGFDPIAIAAPAPAAGFSGRPGFGGYAGGPNSGAPGTMYGDGPAIQAANSQRSQQNLIAYQANELRNRQNESDALAFKLTNTAPGSSYATAPR